MFRCLPLFLLAFTGLLSAAEPLKPDRFEATIAKFEAEQAANPSPKNGNVFIGSSSIRLWNLAEAFPEQPCINYGFGGAVMEEVARYAPRLLPACQPRRVIVYAGDNDLARGVEPKEVVADFDELVDFLAETVPSAEVIILAVKPSPLRWTLREQYLETNELFREIADSNPRVKYADTWSVLLDDNGEPKAEYYQRDKLHLTPEGYAAWNKVVEPMLVD